VIRSIDTWSVLKLSLLFYLSLLVTFLVAGVILWQVAAAAGFTDNLAKLIRSLFDLTSYKFHGKVIFRNVAIGGGVLAVFGSFLNALMCVLYNLISDVVGGISVVLVGEDVERPATAPAAATVATNGSSAAPAARPSRRERAKARTDAQ
jgi:hypothetical protein